MAKQSGAIASFAQIGDLTLEQMFVILGITWENKCSPWDKGGLSQGRPEGNRPTPPVAPYR